MRKSEEGGFALIVVLLVLMVVAIVATDLSHSSRIQAYLARNARNDMAIEEAARGWIEVVKAKLAYDLSQNQIDSEEDEWASEEIQSASLGEVSLEALVVDEASKFDLRKVKSPDKAVRALARERFKRLIQSFRQGSGHELTTGDGETLLEALDDYLEREEGGTFPIPEVGKDDLPILSIDELRMVAGFQDPEDRSKQILYDAFEEETEEDLEETEEVKPLPGLHRFLTLHSEGLININTAPVEVLRCLFPDESQWNLADSIVDYRSGQASNYEDEESAGTGDEESEWMPFKSIQDLTKVEGITSKILSDAKIDGNSVTMASSVFSITVFATRDNLTRQFRAIVKRHGKGFRTLLFEERKDPRVVPPEEEDEGEE